MKLVKSLALLKMIVAVLVLLAYQSVYADSKKATYQLELAIDWSSTLAPYEFPSGAHMSSLIGLTHDSSVVLFEDGATASSGLELLAENGRFGILRAQFDELDRKDRVGTIVIADGVKKVPGKMSTNFGTTTDHPYLSVTTMLAPSPDWFTGASSIRLFENDRWIDSIELPLWVWDAGTDSGLSFTSKNEDTQPRESVRLLSSNHFLNDKGLVSIGSLKLKRLR